MGKRPDDFEDGWMALPEGTVRIGDMSREQLIATIRILVQNQQADFVSRIRQYDAQRGHSYADPSPR